MESEGKKPLTPEQMEKLQEKLAKQLNLLPSFFAYMDNENPPEALLGLNNAKKALKVINEIQKQLTGEDPKLTMAELYKKIDENAGGASNEEYQAAVEENDMLRQANETFAKTEEVYKKRILELEARAASMWNTNIFAPKGLFGRLVPKVKNIWRKWNQARVAVIAWLDAQVDWDTEVVKSVVNIGFGLITFGVLSMGGCGIRSLFSSGRKTTEAIVTTTPVAQNKNEKTMQFSLDSTTITIPNNSFQRMNGNDAMDGFDRTVIVDTFIRQPLRESGVVIENHQGSTAITSYSRLNDTLNNPYNDGFNNGLDHMYRSKESNAPPVDVNQKNFRETMPLNDDPVISIVSIYDYISNDFTARYAVEPGSLKKDRTEISFMDEETHKNITLKQDSLQNINKMFFDNSEECKTVSIDIYDFKKGKNIARYNVIKNSFIENESDGTLTFKELKTGTVVTLKRDELKKYSCDIRDRTICPE